MALRVSLQIDGDAKGAEQAAESASAAISKLGKDAEESTRGLEDVYDRVAGAAGKLANASKAQGAANDNLASSSTGVVNLLDQVAQKTLGADNVLSKLTSGTSAITKQLFSLGSAAGVIGLLSGAFGIATVAASTFYSIVNERAVAASKLLSDNERQVGLVRDAFSGAANKAGDFFVQTSNVSKLLLTLQAGALRESLQSQVGKVISGATTFGDIGDFISKTRQVKAEFLPFEDAIFKLQAGLKQGTPDIKAFMDEVARIGNADPAARKAAGALIELSGESNKTATGLRATDASLNVIKGSATETDRRIIGLSKTTGDAANEYDRLTKSLQRQAAAQEAESLTVGKSAGEAAKLRAEYLLYEAAAQSGKKKTDELAASISEIGDRFGAAAQKTALATLQSNAFFDRSQLGRTASEANVAAQLRTAYGDDVNSQLNGALATSLRFNESMRELKATTLDLASGAFRDVRNEIEAGKSAWDAFGTAGVNAFNKILDKIADKALDNLVSKLFDTFSGSSSSGGILKLLGFSGGGYTGDGGKYEPAGVVHKGEVVFSQSDVSRHGGVAVVEAMRRGVRSYADGGVVGAPSPLAFIRPTGAASQAAAQRVQIDIAVSVDDDGRLAVIAREAGRDGGSEAADVRVRNFSRHELPDRVQQIQQNPRKRG